MSQTRHQNELPDWVSSSAESNELYEELLNRYERILVFAGRLQEKLQQQKLLTSKNESLNDQNERLNKMLEAGEAYIAVLEKGLRELGLAEAQD